MQKKAIVKASEINEFIYCRRCFWKSIHGLKEMNDEMMLGTKKHNRLAFTLAVFDKKWIITVVAFIISLLLFILLLVIRFF